MPKSIQRHSPIALSTQRAVDEKADPRRETLRGMDFAAGAAALSPVQAKGGGESAQGVHDAARHGVSGGGGRLPFMEQIQASFGGHDLSSVQAHTGARAQEGSKAMGAAAYASGNDVVFGQTPDLHTAAHEAAHVVQQRAGVSLSGGVGKAGDAYERQADDVADKVVKGESAAELLGGVGEKGGAQASVQRKMGDEDQENVVFGLASRNKSQIVEAIKQGYTTFDGADTYDDSIYALAEAIAESGKDRKEFEVIYKIDKDYGEGKLAEHLREVAGKLGGYIDHAMVHKSKGPDTDRAVMSVLKSLKPDVILNVGGGDVNAKMGAYFEGDDALDSFEIDAASLFEKDGPELIEKLNTSGKPVLVYNIVKCVTDILGKSPEDLASHVTALVDDIDGLLAHAEPILSSSDKSRMAVNKGVRTDAKYTKEVGTAKGNLKEALITRRASAILDLDGEASLLVFGTLLEPLSGYDFTASTVKQGESELTQEQCAEAAKEIKKLCSSEDLKAICKRDGKGAKTLETLIDEMFLGSTSCARVGALNFLTGAG